MKAFAAIVLISFVSFPCLSLVGGAPPQPQSSTRKNGTLVEQKGQEEMSEVSLAALKQTASQPPNPGTEEVLKNLPGIYPGEDHGGNNTNPISHPITDLDLQNQLNELLSHPGGREGEVNRKEDIGYISAEDESDKHMQTITLDREYTPQDIAEYIFWTGDERGVAMGIKDLLNDGLMLSEDDVIKFLETVKSELDDLRNRYEHYILSHSTPRPSSPISTNRGQESDDGRGTITSVPAYSKGSVADFESKFRRALLRQALNNRRNQGKDSGVTGSIRGLGPRRIPISPTGPQEPRFGAFDHFGSQSILPSIPPSKKNTRASAPRRHYFSQVPEQSVGALEELAELEEESERRGGRVISENDYSNDHSGLDQGPPQTPEYTRYDNNNIQIRNNDNNEGPDFSEIIQRQMKVADDRLRELSLQDIIYNLARELFSRNFKQGAWPLEGGQEFYFSGGRSVGGGGSGGYPAERLPRFIERNLISERTPPAIEKEVQNILFTALVDSAKEQRAFGTRLRNKGEARFRRQINPPPLSSPSRYLL